MSRFVNVNRNPHDIIECVDKTRKDKIRIKRNHKAESVFPLVGGVAALLAILSWGTMDQLCFVVAISEVCILAFFSWFAGETWEVILPVGFAKSTKVVFNTRDDAEAYYAYALAEIESNTRLGRVIIDA